MAKLIVGAGTTSRLEHVFILDSTSTAGAGKTGLTNTSVTMYYFRPGDTTATSVTLSAGTLGTWTTGGFKEVDAVNMPGVYEIGMPNAVFAATFNHSIVMIKGTGIAPVTLEYQLTAAGESWIASGVWNAQLATYATAGTNETFGTDTYGTKVSRSVAANRPIAVNTNNGVTVGGFNNAAITNAAFQTSAISSTTFAANALDAVWSTTARTITGTSAGAVTATSFGDDALVIGAAAGTGIKIRFAADSITSTVIATDAITNAELAATSVQEIWDYNISAYSTAGLAGTYLKNAGAAGNPWLTDISNATTYPTTTTAGGYVRSIFTETTGLSTAVTNLPLNTWTSIFTSDSATYGQFSSYTMADVMALLVKGYCAIFGTVQASPAPTTTTIKSSLTGYTNNAFNDQTIVFLKGSSIAGSCTVISSSNASGNLVFDEPLHQAPAVGAEFMILPIHVHLRGAIADKLLGRTIAGAADGGRTVTDALRALRNRSQVTAGTLTVYQENDTTSAWTATVTQDATAVPITQIDPA